VRRQLRRHLVGLACLAAAGIVGIAAIVDHRWEQERGNRAQLAEWYCSHQATRCGGPSSARIEAHWEQRELGYKITIAVLCAAGAALLVARSLRAPH
jgi:hypothetical protein